MRDTGSVIPEILAVREATRRRGGRRSHLPHTPVAQAPGEEGEASNSQPLPNDQESIKLPGAA